MADFSPTSDKEDSDVDAIIAQAKDLVVLEQVSSINLSCFSDDSVLPTDLETRFRKLKSFPETKPRHQFQHSNQSPPIEPKSLAENPQFRESSDPDFDKKSPKSISSPSLSSGSSTHSRSRSPNREVVCCFWRSPKGVSSKKKKKKKKGKENNRVSKKLDWGKIESDDLEFLSDLNVFSEKERKRSMKKLLKEEEKISREAEKIVQWAKKESARMNSINSEIVGDEFEIGSDDENFKR